jgi:hypothetical protein
MDKLSHQWGILNEFFSDINVDFPQKPKLVNGISVYTAPNGLGVQFRGGSEKLVIKGKNSALVWKFLTKTMTGDNTLEKIFQLSTNSDVDSFEVATFLKTLHSYHLLCAENETNMSNIIYHFDLFSTKQKEYYDRIIGHSGINASGAEALDKIRNSKILVIANAELVPIISYNMHLAGFKDLGVLLISDTNSDNVRDYIENINIITYQDITNIKGEALRTLLSIKLDNYHYVLTIISNPNLHFLGEISRFCSLKNKPMLNISIVENSYEIGPFFFPNSDTACISCYHLRKQSYDNHSLYDFLYQNNLEDRELKYDNEIRGFDIQGFCSVLNFAILQLKYSISKVAKPIYINQVVKINALNFCIIKEDIIQVPGCLSCSTHSN